MAFTHQISLTADSGVGSTTTAKVLHSMLGVSPWRWVNAGAIMRTFAAELGLSIEEFGIYNSAHPEKEHDKECDGMVRLFGEQDYVIFEGRLVHHFAPQAFHVRLVCDPEVRAQRRAKDFPNMTVEEVLRKIEERDFVNTTRYTDRYSKEVIWADSQFDLVLDTGLHTPEVIAEKILEGHKEWVGKL